MVELNRAYPFLAPLLYHLVSGGAFFTGAGLIILSAALSFCGCHRLIGMAIRVLAVVGAGAILLSSTPFATIVYLTGAAILAIWLILEERPAPRGARPVCIARGIIIASTLTTILVEMPKHVTHPVRAQHCETLYVLGDSISAGVQQDQLVWPTILARAHNVQVANLSRPGAQVSSILPEADRIQPGACVVLIEIGGNDLLNRVDVDRFESDLRSLLRSACAPGRSVAMLELPLPPLCAAFGRAQRRMAREFDVTLVPKRLFAKILTGPGRTTDGLHLSDRGHQDMARMVWRVIGSAMSRSDS